MTLSLVNCPSISDLIRVRIRLLWWRRCRPIKLFLDAWYFRMKYYLFDFSFLVLSLFPFVRLSLRLEISDESRCVVWRWTHSQQKKKNTNKNRNRRILNERVSFIWMYISLPSYPRVLACQLAHHHVHFFQDQSEIKHLMDNWCYLSTLYIAPIGFRLGKLVG